VDVCRGRQAGRRDRAPIHRGSCPNITCLPSKNIIHSAKVAFYFRRSKEFGIHDAGFQIDMAGVRDRKRTMVAGLNRIYLDNY
jgi:pyruvate/2-oxoglutarate dehydrogenase complex dihydrolipoamide dehydrogenase (E3) component